MSLSKRGSRYQSPNRFPENAHARLTCEIKRQGEQSYRKNAGSSFENTTMSPGKARVIHCSSTVPVPNKAVQHFNARKARAISP